MRTGRGTVAALHTAVLSTLLCLAIVAFPGSPGHGAASSPPIQSVSMDADGNLVVNGRPFLLIAGQKVDYAWWDAAGYTRGQADLKLGQLRAAGVNSIDLGNWFGAPYQDQALWNQFGFYWIGSAVLDGQGHNAQGDWTAARQITAIVNEFKARPNLLRWYVATELNPEVADQKGWRSSYAAAVAAIRAADPAHPVVGDLTVFAGATTEWLTPSLNQAPLIEEALGYPSTGITIQHLLDALLAMNAAWQRGQRFVAGVSATPIPELDRPLRPDFSGPSRAELRRFFLWPVALNVKAFEVLWGANQRGYRGGRSGDSTLPPAALRVWKDTLDTLSEVKSLESVILAPGRFVPLTAAPAFRIGGVDNNVRPLYGIYAAKKVIGRDVYVIAVNANEAGPAAGVPRGYDDTRVDGARIDVGVPIGTVVRMPDTGTVSFAGSTIADSFDPMATHVYKVAPR